jgi:8-oxo-dGTP pyrophosphatase MutT (NUDIX family)
VPSRVRAAVLIPVFRDDDDRLRLVLVVRAPSGLHGGQLSLPGGRQEETDASLVDTALREAEEEIGLRRVDITVVCSLTPVETRTTGFLVHPYLARIRVPSRWRLARNEIVGVLTPLVDVLADRSRRQRERVDFPGWQTPRSVECLRLDGGYILWGLTLRLIDAVAPRLLEGESRV